MLGFDMRLRHALCRLFFGPARPVYEGLFAAAPDGLGMGVRYFAGRPIERAKAARVALDLAGHFWKHRDESPFQALPIS